jgi:hypothetical protein
MQQPQQNIGAFGFLGIYGTLFHLRTTNYNKTLIGYKCTILSSIVAAVEKNLSHNFYSSHSRATFKYF